MDPEVDALWKRLCTKRPALAKPEAEVQIDSGNLNKLLKQFYEQGARGAKSLNETQSGSSIFNSIFGK